MEFVLLGLEFVWNLSPFHSLHPLQLERNFASRWIILRVSPIPNLDDIWMRLWIWSWCWKRLRILRLLGWGVCILHTRRTWIGKGSRVRILQAELCLPQIHPLKPKPSLYLYLAIKPFRLKNVIRVGHHSSSTDGLIKKRDTRSSCSQKKGQMRKQP